MMNKKTLAVVGVVVVALAAGFFVPGSSLTGSLVSGLQADSSGSEKGPIKVGATLPITGQVSMYGEAFKNGLKMAEEEINAEGGINGRDIELVIEDNRLKTEEAVSDYKKLTSVDEVDVVFTSFTNPTKSLTPLADKDQNLLISGTAYPIGGESEYVFMDYWNIGDQGRALAKAANQEGIDKIALTYLKTPECGEVFPNEFKQHFKGKIVAEQGYQFGSKDLRTPLTKVKQGDPEGIVNCALPQYSHMFLKQMTELGMDDLKTFGVQFHEPPAATAGEKYLKKLEKPINIQYPMQADNPASKEFIQKYKDKFGQEPRVDAAYMYDDLKVLADAMRECDKTGAPDSPDCLKDKILEVEGYQGAAGELSFDKEGNSNRPTLLGQYVDGEWKDYSLSG